MNKALVIFFGLMLGLTLTNVTAQTQDLTPEQLQRYYELTEELRCLVCQNQNIAESNAPLALDLRAQVEQMIREGQSDQQIKSYMTDRYGDFVLYRPPVRKQTLLLWLAPPFLLFLGLLVAWVLTRKRQSVPLQVVDKKRLDDLLGSSPSKDESEGNRLSGEN